MSTRTIERYNRARARKLERKDEDVAWLLAQRTRKCGLCGKGYTANTRERPDVMKVRRWCKVEICRDCQANKIEVIEVLAKMKVVKFNKVLLPEFKPKRSDRWKHRDPQVFMKAYARPDEEQMWSLGCEICGLWYFKTGKQMKWKGFKICGSCLKATRVIPRLISLGVVKYTKEYR